MYGPLLQYPCGLSEWKLLPWSCAVLWWKSLLTRCAIPTKNLLTSRKICCSHITAAFYQDLCRIASATSCSRLFQFHIMPNNSSSSSQALGFTSVCWCPWILLQCTYDCVNNYENHLLESSLWSAEDSDSFLNVLPHELRNSSLAGTGGMVLEKAYMYFELLPWHSQKCKCLGACPQDIGKSILPNDLRLQEHNGTLLSWPLAMHLMANTFHSLGLQSWVEWEKQLRHKFAKQQGLYISKVYG